MHIDIYKYQRFIAYERVCAYMYIYVCVCVGFFPRTEHDFCIIAFIDSCVSTNVVSNNNLIGLK